MMPGIANFDLYRGDDFAQDFLINDPVADPDVDPLVPMNLTGFTASAQIKLNAVDASAEATMTITFATPRTLGVITAEVAADDLDVGEWVYDIQFVNGAGKKKTYIRGTITVYQDVTRP